MLLPKNIARSWHLILLIWKLLARLTMVALLSETIYQIYNEALYNNTGVDRTNLIFTQLHPNQTIALTPPLSPITPSSTSQNKNKIKDTAPILLYSYLKHDIEQLLKNSMEVLGTIPNIIIDKFEK